MPTEHEALCTVFSKPHVFAEVFNQHKRSHPNDADWPFLDPALLSNHSTYWLLHHDSNRSDARQTLVLMEDSKNIYLLALESFQDQNLPIYVRHWDLSLRGYKDKRFVNPEPTWHRKPHYIMAAYLGTETYTSVLRLTDTGHPDIPSLPSQLAAEIELYVQLASFTDQSEAENAAYQTELRELAEALRLAHGKTRPELRTLVRTHPLFQSMDADVARLLAELLHVAYPVGDAGATRLNLARGEELVFEENCKECLDCLMAYMAKHHGWN